MRSAGPLCWIAGAVGCSRVGSVNPWRLHAENAALAGPLGALLRVGDLAAKWSGSVLTNCPDRRFAGLILQKRPSPVSPPASTSASIDRRSRPPPPDCVSNTPSLD